MQLQKGDNVKITTAGYGVSAGSSGEIRSISKRRTMLINVTHTPNCDLRSRARFAFAVSEQDVEIFRCPR